MTRPEVLKMLSAESNPLIKQKLKDLLKKMDFFAIEEKPLLADLINIGIDVESVWDLVNNIPQPMLEQPFSGNYEIAYPILLKHLDYDYHPKIREGIIRALTEKNASKIALERILELFYKETDSNLKWVMANALRTLMTKKQREKHPEVIDTWKK